MKSLFGNRWFSRTSLIVTLATMPAFTSYAEDEKSDTKTESAEKQEKAPAAIHGTAKIDGNIDDAWEHAVEFEVNKPVTSDTTIDSDKMATAKVKLMWDDEHVYALWQVKDSKLSDTSSDAYQQDSIEFFIDENNEKAGVYQKDDAQYRVSYKGKLSGGETSKTDNVTAVAKETASGYIVEMSVKRGSGKFEAGKKLGIELQVNDDNGSGSRVAIAKWHHAKNDSYQSTSDFGTVELVEKN